MGGSSSPSPTLADKVVDPRRTSLYLDVDGCLKSVFVQGPRDGSTTQGESIFVVSNHPSGVGGRLTKDLLAPRRGWTSQVRLHPNDTTFGVECTRWDVTRRPNSPERTRRQVYEGVPTYLDVGGCHTSVFT